jgi:hypothetical protein
MIAARSSHISGSSNTQETDSSGGGLPATLTSELLAQAILHLQKQTLVDLRTAKGGIRLGDVVEPHLLELRCFLSTAGDELPPRFIGIKTWVETNLAMIQELGNDTEVASEIASWWRRMEWLYEEYRELCLDERGADVAGEARPSPALQGWRRLFLENSTNGVPREWLKSHRAPKTPIAHFEILAPVRLIGAELFMLCSRISALGNACAPRLADFDRFFNHVSVHRCEFQQLEKTGKTSLDLTGAIEDLLRVERVAKRWAEGDLTYVEFRDMAWEAYQDLSAKTTLVEVSKARELSLSLLEFNTEYSGICWDLLPLLENIDRALLIDPTLERPQKGLATLCPRDVTEAVLRSVGCRVFLLQLGAETVGYYVFAPNPPGAVIPTATLFQDLAHEGLIKDPMHARYGFFHGVAITEAARNTLRSSGTWGYGLLDSQMAQTAVYEGCNVLVCTVRSGKNANLAKPRHVEAGWEETGFEVTRTGGGKVPLEVLLRHTATGLTLPPGGIPLPPENWGLNPHYRTYTSADRNDTRFTTAATISDYEAQARCRQLFGRLGHDFTVQTYHGSLGFYITIISASGNSHINLHQQRPGFDLWYCSATESSASLQQHFEKLSTLARAPLASK